MRTITLKLDDDIHKKFENELEAAKILCKCTSWETYFIDKCLDNSKGGKKIK